MLTAFKSVSPSCQCAYVSCALHTVKDPQSLSAVSFEMPSVTPSLQNTPLITRKPTRSTSLQDEPIFFASIEPRAMLRHAVSRPPEFYCRACRLRQLGKVYTVAYTARDSCVPISKLPCAYIAHTHTITYTSQIMVNTIDSWRLPRSLQCVAKDLMDASWCHRNNGQHDAMYTSPPWVYISHTSGQRHIAELDWYNRWYNVFMKITIMCAVCNQERIMMSSQRHQFCILTTDVVYTNIVYTTVCARQHAVRAVQGWNVYTCWMECA